MIPNIETHPIAHLASGDTLSIQLHRFIGDSPGQVAYLQSNLHGAEVSGNLVLYRLIERLCALDASQLRGEIRIVPSCNPLATNQRSQHFSSGRYNPYTGHDWNRIFWDYEKHAAAHPETHSIADFADRHSNADPATIQDRYRQRIRETFAEIGDRFETPNGLPFEQRYRYRLQNLCLDADYIIDCHSSSNRALDYLYCFQGREASADAFLLPYGILMRDYDGDAFDEAFCKPWLALERELAARDRPIVFDVEAWTLELGAGMGADADVVDRGLRGILNYLASKGMLDLPDFPRPETSDHQTQLFDRSQYVEYYAPCGGTISQRADLGDRVFQGQFLYQLVSFGRGETPPSQRTVCARRGGLVFDVGHNCSVNEGEYVLTVMEDACESAD